MISSTAMVVVATTATGADPGWVSHTKNCSWRESKALLLLCSNIARSKLILLPCGCLSVSPILSNSWLLLFSTIILTNMTDPDFCTKLEVVTQSCNLKAIETALAARREMLGPCASFSISWRLAWSLAIAAAAAGAKPAVTAMLASVSLPRASVVCISFSSLSASAGSEVEDRALFSCCCLSWRLAKAFDKLANCRCFSAECWESCLSLLASKVCQIWNCSASSCSPRSVFEIISTICSFCFVAILQSLVIASTAALLVLFNSFCLRADSWADLAANWSARTARLLSLGFLSEISWCSAAAAGKSAAAIILDEICCFTASTVCTSIKSICARSKEVADSVWLICRSLSCLSTSFLDRSESWRFFSASIRAIWLSLSASKAFMILACSSSKDSPCCRRVIMLIIWLLCC
mmetsp:Transcript_12384/g.23752  ORF Transcript_12384/g.23752 Transcript_12384/m.23752 type:complete len:408 (-) Transcript_12384:536-1759(-)